jgi:hypothetical protein
MVRERPAQVRLNITQRLSKNNAAVFEFSQLAMERRSSKTSIFCQDRLGTIIYTKEVEGKKQPFSRFSFLHLSHQTAHRFRIDRRVLIRLLC